MDTTQETTQIAAELNKLPKPTSYNSLYLLAQQAFENGFRSMTINELVVYLSKNLPDDLTKSEFIYEKFAPGSTLPDPGREASVFLGAGTYSTPGGGPDLVLEENFNVVSWDGDKWVKLLEIPIEVPEPDLAPYALNGGSEKTLAEVEQETKDNYATIADAGVMTNVAVNRDFSEGPTGWQFEGNIWSVTLDPTIGKNVITNDQALTTAIVYARQDILLPQGHKVYVSSKIRNHTSEGSAVLLAVSDIGGIGNVIRESNLTSAYSVSSILFQVNTTGIRVSAQVNAGKKGSFTDFIVIDLTALFGAGNEPTKAEFDLLLSKTNYDFKTKNLISLQANQRLDSLQSEVADKATKKEVGIINNLVSKGDFANGEAWYVDADFDILLDETIGEYVLRNKINASVKYYQKDIMIPSGHKFFISALAKTTLASPSGAFIVTSNYGGRSGNVIRYSVDNLQYQYKQVIGVVPSGTQGIRLSFQFVANQISSFTNIVMLDLTAIYGAGNEPEVEEMQAIIADSNGYFDEMNLLNVTKADKAYVDEELSNKATITDVVTVTDTKVFDLSNEVYKSRYEVEDYSLIGSEWTDGFFVFMPTKNNVAYRLKVTDNTILGVDFANLIDMYGDGEVRIIVEMNEVRSIDFLDNILWADNKPAFNKAGIYVIEAVSQGDKVVMYLEGFSEFKVTVNRTLYVDNRGYTNAQLYPTTGGLLVETATRTTSSWSNPFKYLQNAINAAQEGDEIWVAGVEYKPTHLRNKVTYDSGDCKSQLATFTTKSGVNNYSGFVGTETSRSQRGLFKTIISGDINNIVTTLREGVLYGDRRKLDEIDGFTENLIYGNVSVITVWDNFDIRYSGTNKPGGAVFGDTSRKLTLRNCYIHDVSVFSQSPCYYITTIDTKFEHMSQTNMAGAGGAIERGNIFNCEFIRCYSGSYGGAAHYSSIYNSYFDGNYGGESGGSIHSSIVRSCIIKNTHCANNGGALYRSTIYDSEIENASADNFGGGTFNSTAFRVTYRNCSAASRGGGMHSTIATDCLIYDSRAGFGGGWYGGTVLNTIAVNCEGIGATGVAAWAVGVNKNCLALNCESKLYAITYQGDNTNCAVINSRGTMTVRRAETLFKAVNCLYYNNQKMDGSKAGYDPTTPSTQIQVLKNCVSDTPNPSAGGASGSNMDLASCFPNATIDQIKINVPSFVGNATTEEQEAELVAFVQSIKAMLVPKAGSILIGNGINTPQYPAPERDFAGVARPVNCSIGIFEPDEIW